MTEATMNRTGTTWTTTVNGTVVDESHGLPRFDEFYTAIRRAGYEPTESARITETGWSARITTGR